MHREVLLHDDRVGRAGDYFCCYRERDRGHGRDYHRQPRVDGDEHEFGGGYGYAGEWEFDGVGGADCYGEWGGGVEEGWGGGWVGWVCCCADGAVRWV